MESGLNSQVINQAENVKRIFLIDRADRLRVPGSDDGPDLPAGSPTWFDDDPFEDVGSQVELLSQEDFFPYLDLQAWTGGVVQEEVFEDEDCSRIEREYDHEYGMVYACGHSAVMLGSDTFDDYYHPLDCRRAWCPVCGGKEGRVHQARKKAVRKRLDIVKNNLRYFVFTVPNEYRNKFKSRKGLNQLFKGVKGIVKKYLGENKGVAASIHLYGDKDKSKFNPHINVLIPELLSVKLKIQPEMLEEIKKSWLRSLIGMGCDGCKVVDVFYEFRIKAAHKGHVIKYVVRPTWDNETLSLIEESERWFLVLGLKGFQYIRFWGDLANCKYREGTMETIEEAIEESEKIAGKKLYFRGICNVNIPEMLKKGLIEKVGEGLYKRIKKGV
jgi:hypothetical protein